MNKWPAMLIALCAGVALSSGAASGAEGGGATPAPDALRSKILRCFSPPLGESTPATVSITLGTDGTLIGEPKVLAQGSTPLDQAFAKAAVRAILRCAPYAGAAAQTVSVTFAAAPETSVPAAALAKTVAVAIPLAGRTVTVPLAEGLCAVSPSGPPPQVNIWRRFVPPPDRGTELVGLALDCATLADAQAGGWERPKQVLTFLAGAAQTEFTPLDAYLDTLAQRFGAREPLTDRFWQAPPMAGAPLLGRDARAVYVAQRQLRKADGIALAGVSAYSRIGRTPLIVNVLTMDGSDVTPATRAIAEGLVARLHAAASAP